MLLAVGGLVALYGLLYLIGLLAQPRLERMADLDASAVEVEGYRLEEYVEETPEDDSASAQARYLRALAHLREAHTSTLGLFPGYDEERLSEAARLLGEVIEQAESGSFLQQEAYFYLGKARLAQEKPSEAREALRQVALSEGRNSERAAELLRELHEVEPAPPPKGFDTDG